MSEQSRERIFARLTAGSQQPSAPIVKPDPIPAKIYNRTEKIGKLKTLMEAMRTEVHITDAQNWIHQLEEILIRRPWVRPCKAIGEKTPSACRK
jgi:hypothetical protein